MKKFLQNILARALCVLALGIVLIALSTRIAEWLVMLSGVVFIVPGLVSLISYFRKEPAQRQIMLYPVMAAGSILFGLVLMIWPVHFLAWIVYILCALLLLVSATQFYTLWDIHRKGIPLHPAHYLVPALELSASLYVFLSGKAVEAAGLPIILLGCGFIFYALLELWTIVLLRRAMTGGSVVKVEEM